MYTVSFAARFLRAAVRIIALVAALITLHFSTSNATLVSASATSNSVTLTWTAPGDDGDVGTATQYDIRYSTSLITESNWTQATSAGDVPMPQPAGSMESFTVAGLSSSTTYYFAVKTADEVPNWSPISNVVSVSTTPEESAPANIADLNVVERYRYSILLGWTAPGDDGSTGTASIYDLRYHTSLITTANWDSATQIGNEPTPSVAGTPETCTVAGLSESTAYFFAIKTADEVPNWSGLSNVVSTSTRGDEEPPSAIEDLQASSGENIGEIDLSWTAPGDDGLMGTATSYQIRFSQSIITDINWDSAALCPSPPDPLVCGEVQATTLCSLSAGDMYYIAVKTYDDNGNLSALSNVDSAVAKYSLILDVDDDNGDLPDHFELSQNHPNPFNPTTEIWFSLPTGCRVSLDIYNSVGQRVATLVDEAMPAGQHVARWNGIGSNGQSVASGVYFYRLLAEDFFDSKKMVLLK
jgi:hypothetical protein